MLTSSLQESASSAVTNASYKAPLTEIIRRKNFAIISHPDAGKTTLTEKLLLFGGAIQDAGAVKARADQRKATSDWMEIEKQRGISVTSTVLSFEYVLNKNKLHINLLDTPGHEDFSEDTYRTLAAADNVVMLIDAAKGIEDRTRKLFDVCKFRRLPIFSFVNKLDRPSQSPLDLIDQIEKEFLLEACPMNWPIGDGDDFQGVFDRTSREVHLFTRGNRRKKISSQILPLGSDLQEEIGDALYRQLIEDIELLDNVLPLPDILKIIEGKQSPIFFGSAITSFGVELFLKTFLQYARSPAQREALLLGIGSAASGTGGEQITNAPFTSLSSSTSPISFKFNTSSLSSISPNFNEFSGFVFKLQANLDPRHRDRLAFIRIVSGSYRKGMKVQHSRLRKTINLSQAQSLFAQERESVEAAYPGDVVGLHNPGHFAIGDTVFTGR
ncbi:GTP-binding protein [archaeon]|nr:MAG: GTP-binding protein [archaeon]